MPGRAPATSSRWSKCERVGRGVSELRLGEAVEAWFKQADAALYRAKDAGRNRVAPGADHAAFWLDPETAHISAAAILRGVEAAQFGTPLQRRAAEVSQRLR